MNSMTGFGRAKLEREGREYLVEIKSVNHKYSDISIKLPHNLLYLEDKMRKAVLNRIARGKFDIYVTYNNYGIGGKKVIINKELAKLYIEQLKELAEETEITSGLRVTEISKLPDVLNVQMEEEESDIIGNELLECLENALDNLIDMRAIEGNKIKRDLETRLEKIAQNVDEILQHSTGLVEEYVVKLEERIKKILQTDVIDQARLAQEVVIYSDKCSIEEEITRLKSHIMQFKTLLEQEEPCGKKLDFLVQEMNREVNTIGSKSGKLEITNLVVELKTQIEDVREQIIE